MGTNGLAIWIALALTVDAAAQTVPSPADAPPVPNAEPEGERSRIVGGAPIALSQAPWQVEIQNLSARSGKWFHWCGGALIAPRWVLTAGHCILTYDGGPVEEVDLGKVPQIRRVLAGSATSGGPRMEIFTVVRAYIAPDFRNRRSANPAPQTANDIALLYLDRPVPGPPSRVIDMAEGDAMLPPLSSAGISVSGWGAEVPDGPQSLALKKAANLKLVPAAACPSAARLDPATIICAWQPPKPGTTVVRAQAGTCQGDSGGPLVSGASVDEAVLIGVVSLGPSQCWDGPAVFTRVAAYLSWITATMASVGQ